MPNMSVLSNTESASSSAMKSPPVVSDDCDDIFGPPRAYPISFCPSKNRPSMISAKYRQKEERRKVLKISINKMKKIEDPEASLCRSVLINNTMKQLQNEARHEKIQKQQLNYPLCYSNESILNIKTEFLKNESKIALDDTQDFASADIKLDSLKVDFVMEEEFDRVASKNAEIFSSFTSKAPEPVASNEKILRKRSFDDMEDCDVQDVLSQFYMPPTPRMLTCIDDDHDDEDINVVDVPKRAKLDNEMPISMCDKSDNFNANTFITNVSSDMRLRYHPNKSEKDSTSFSCGHASMLNELQSNVYHNLIASLET